MAGDPTAHSVPRGVRATSEWAWRLVLIGVAVVLTVWVLSRLAEVVVPVLVALLLAALLHPLHDRLRLVMPSGLAAAVTVLGTLAGIGVLLTIVVRQVSQQFDELAAQVVEGIRQVRAWVEETFGLTDSQFSDYVEKVRDAVGSSEGLAQTAAQAGLTATTVITGFFLAMFVLFFFLHDGASIWGWVVRLFPRSARPEVVSSGKIAWGQLSAFTRATVLVAAADATGIGLGAVVLGVPFASGIALLVFLGSFVPIVGAFVSGLVAVLLALVAKGPITALIMFGIVLAVQQIESQLLQPLLLGRAVRVHPVAVILAIAAGILLGGVIGALIAVPIVAVANAVGHHLLDGDPDVEHADDVLTDDERQEVEERLADDGPEDEA